MACIGALSTAEVSLDMAGLLDNPEYIRQLDPTLRPAALERQNVYMFSMSVAAHEALQFAGLVTGLPQVGGYRPQRYHAYPGRMDVSRVTECAPQCQYAALTSSAADMRGNLRG
jgi:hypothetical protein